MTTALILAGPQDAPRALDLMARHHEETQQPYDDAHREAVVAPILEGSPLGAIWLIGPQRAPLGYVMVTFGWSVPLGGMIGWLTEVFIRPSVRRRGIGTEVVHSVAVSLREAGMKALHAHAAGPDDIASRFCRRVGFTGSETVILMTDRL